MKFILVSLLSLSLSTFAANKNSEKEKLITGMVTSCKAELAKDPAMTDKSDAEAVWKNIEDKEHGSVKLSKACHNAHEKYEHKYHKEDEENEKNESHD